MPKFFNEHVRTYGEKPETLDLNMNIVIWRIEKRVPISATMSKRGYGVGIIGSEIGDWGLEGAMMGTNFNIAEIILTFWIESKGVNSEVEGVGKRT